MGGHLIGINMNNIINEIDDYNSEYFFNKEYELEEYNSILDTFDSSMREEEKDSAYNIFILEQAISTIHDIEHQVADMSVHAENACRSIEKFIEIYTEKCKD